jgi:thiol-disulfide isomerase/thioredoxin
LLQAGADINQVNNFGVSAIQIAAERGHTGIARLLLESHAKLTPKGADWSGALPAAAYRGHFDIVQMLLEAGAWVDQNRAGLDKQTPIFFAVMFKHEEVADLLIRHGADLNHLDADGMSPADIAVLTGQPHLAEKIQKAGGRLVNAGQPSLQEGANKKSFPPLGEEPPGVVAKGWLNSDDRPSLSNRKGKVIMVEFWATWCGPCHKIQPVLAKLYQRHRDQGLEYLALTQEDRLVVDRFVKKTKMGNPVGYGSRSFDHYRIRTIPQLFLIGRDGKLIWGGHPAWSGLDRAIQQALAAAPSR